MSRRRLWLLLLAVSTLWVVPVGRAAASSSGLPKVLSCAGKLVVRPVSYVLSCADANTYFNAIHWTRWGSGSATGSATYVQNSCEPTCAEGTFERYPATLTLSKPVDTRYGRLFSVIRYRYTVSSSSTLPLQPLSAVTSPSARPRCSMDPEIAAQHVIPPPPFSVREVVVQRTAMPPSEPAGRGPSYKRLYRVRFAVVRGNAVLPSGHTYTQFAYVSRTSTSAPWCFVRGGSGP